MATHSTILAGESHGQRSLAWDSVPSVARVGHNLVTKTPGESTYSRQTQWKLFLSTNPLALA